MLFYILEYHLWPMIPFISYLKADDDEQKLHGTLRRLNMCAPHFKHCNEWLSGLRHTSPTILSTHMERGWRTQYWVMRPPPMALCLYNCLLSCIKVIAVLHWGFYSYKTKGNVLYVDSCRHSNSHVICIFCS